jgi:hypothetical protein
MPLKTTDLRLRLPRRAFCHTPLQLIRRQYSLAIADRQTDTTPLYFFNSQD